ncbi:MAG: 3-hydroxybutyryl-CoA dehydrogenase [Leifsonia sp.]|nr:3-hydroxybutyryl-CoA dehydrogenase [Leifsonia sp.]|tara:strand:- start:2723 stop:3577 length:855 start_codon:yes stop_codon:yes gene_type:complete
MTAIKKVTVLGTGVLGSQIAYQTAFHGFEVTAWDIDDAAVAAAHTRFAGLAATYDAEVDGAKDGKSAAALERITVTSDLADAVKDADLVIEAVPENPAIKTDTWTKVGELAPEKTIFATNTSTLLPSSFMEATGRPEKFLALHYANRIWAMNTAEIMGTSKTDAAVFDTVVEFATEQGMVPIPLKKEQPGYVLNSLLVPLLNAASALLVNEVAEPETIDATWRIGTGAPLGPFQIFDVVGLTTAYNVSVMGDETSKKFAELVKRDYIDQGKLGVATGEGFYRYS